MISTPEQESKSIDQVEDGNFVRITGFDAGKGALSRLCALGLVPGTVVQVITNGKGPVKLRFRETEVVIGRKFAEKIKVQPYKDHA
jgi:ferrous iron transport protein A